jgi:hypothetical protein
LSIIEETGRSRSRLLSEAEWREFKAFTSQPEIEDL